MNCTFLISALVGFICGVPLGLVIYFKFQDRIDACTEYLLGRCL